MFKQKPTLYHATSYEIQDGLLSPRPEKTYVYHEFADDPEEQKKHIGNFLFAGTNLDAAYVYSLKNHLTSLGTGIFELPKELVGDMGKTHLAFTVVNNKTKFIEGIATSPPKIYTIPANNNFVPVLHKSGKQSGEWISHEALPVSSCQVKEVNNIEEVMQRGVQIFFTRDEITKDKWREIKQSDAVEQPLLRQVYAKVKQCIGVIMQFVERMFSAPNESTAIPANDPVALKDMEYHQWLSHMNNLVKQGVIIHENAERGIKPLNLETGKIEQGFSDKPLQVETSLQPEWLQQLLQRNTQPQMERAL